jgi:Zn-dependent peptidase ImmA (M78 family)
MKIFEISDPNKVHQIKKFTTWAVRVLNISNNPKIKLSNNKDEVENKRTFGTTTSVGEIWVYVGDRNIADILRTLCHELVHYKQFEVGLANENMSDEQNQNIEDVANAMAGRMLRKYGKIHVEIY